jgi:hypothetical protein
MGWMGFEPGKEVALILTVEDIADPTNNPVVGLSPTASIRRVTDAYWYNFTTNLWAYYETLEELPPEFKVIVADRSDSSYIQMWNQGTADPGSGGSTYKEETYVVFFEITDENYQNIPSDTITFSNAAQAISENIAEEVWTYATRTLTAWLNGSVIATFQVRNEDGDPVGGVNLSVYNSVGQRLVWLISNQSTGDAIIPLDPGTGYFVLVNPSPAYVGSNPYNFDIGTDPTQTIPIGIDITNLLIPEGVVMCRVYAYLRDLTGSAIPVGTGSIQVVAVHNVPILTNVIFAENRETSISDSDGLVFVDVCQGVECSIEVSVTGVDNVIRTSTVRLTVPNENSYDISGDIEY